MLKLLKALFRGHRLRNFQDIESNSLGERSILSHCDKITEIDISKTRAHVRGEGLVTFLVSLVLLDKMKVIPSQNNRTIHLHRLHNPCENSSSDADISCERTFFVDVMAFHSVAWCLES